MAFGIAQLTAEVRLLVLEVKALAREIHRLDEQIIAFRTPVLNKLDVLQKEVTKIPTKQDLDDAVAEVLTGVNNLGTAMLAAFTRLEAKIGQGIDATSDIASLKDLAQQVAGLTAQAAAEAADNPPTP